ncbi:M23 family metallopeptidase [Pseudobacter ginsenosidimutans]|uniref:Murein DD-endopeptidase MepM/ murein hydrolase activator NlpD n=1 Tax=Pseudobacter ginsenosidimutans TaxID=661488 RepID=A0A4Q7MTQ1_9BACT|nr:M23 family metallopeptidase [Pseudobacter ginsenosidimutans]QEC41849.1 peptidoglycan DD-metalloendopeptidase family protein [Pseudobacter ginsenosidimutans]RZS71334.1 murein DD-endopeptidase MepM/ murein hydrolase activator NlpD [Pseudobacter ginsenosidimutans]
MKKIKYYYNTNTLRYEKLETPLRVKLLRVLGFISAAIVTAIIIVSIAYRYFPSANEKKLMEENEKLEDQFESLEQAARKLSQRLTELESRDNDIYRTIFEANPIPDSIRALEMAQQKEWRLVNSMTNSELENSIVQTLNNLNNRMSNQDKSYGEITKFIANKEELLACTPAIQPVSNSDLKRVASGFGSRIDPVYKTIKFHAGLDFSAPQGTPIYATANGSIRTAGNLGNGYGNHVIINHGYGYETLYGHMFKVKVKSGQKVKRGEIIGWVGSTGKSTGPHCHYEVHKNGRPIDPIYFFYNDLTPEQFDRMLKMAASSNQSFD